MTKVLVLGANGMLGHKLYQVLGETCDVTGTVRCEFKDISKYGIFKESNIISKVNAMEVEPVARAVANVKPDIVVNCIGVVKSLVAKAGNERTTRLNALFPHQLYEICRTRKARLIHISTDCVFSGKKGNYNEDSPSDAEDVYGKTKYLGEVNEPDALTIRTSIIGRELAGSNGLVEWFIANRGGRVQGYTNAIFTGFPTLHLSRIIGEIIGKHSKLNGLYHVASEPISKYDLLVLINDAMKLNIEIKEYPDERVDRSLDGSRFRKAAGFAPLPWKQMVTEMAADAAIYARWR